MSFTIWLVLGICAFNVLIRKFSFIEAFAFLLPFKTIHFDLGLMANAYYFPLALAAFVELLYKGKDFKFDKKLFSFLIYTILSTIIISNFFIDHWERNVFGGYFREEGRYISSLLRISVFQIGIAFIVYNSLSNRNKLMDLINKYLLGVNVLVFIGVIQLIYFILFGEDLFPYNIGEDGKAVSAIYEKLVSNFNLLRLTSLGGEPKGLAATLVIALTISLLARKFNVKSINQSRFKRILYLFILILTFSTGGYGLLFLLFLIIAILDIFSLSWKIPKLKAVHIISFICLGFLVFKYSDVFYTIIDNRIIQRSERLLTEDIDQAIQDFLIDNPSWTVFGSGSGNIHNLSYDYIDDSYLSWLMKGEIFVSRYGIIRLISENGFLGLILFLIFYIGLLFKLRKSSILSKNEKKFWFYSIAVCMIFYFARSGYVEAELYFISGLALSNINIYFQK